MGCIVVWFCLCVDSETQLSCLFELILLSIPVCHWVQVLSFSCLTVYHSFQLVSELSLDSSSNCWKSLSISDWEIAQAELFVWIFCLLNYSIWEKNKCSFYNIRNVNVFELSLTSVANLLPTFLFLKSESNVGLELKSTC